MRRAEHPCLLPPWLGFLLAVFSSLLGALWWEERWEPSLQVVERWTKLGVATKSQLVDLGGT